MSRRKRWLVISGMVIGMMIVLLPVAAYAIGHIRPSVPVEWLGVRAGMTRTEVLERVPDEVHDMRELKGSDFFNREGRQWGFRRWTYYFSVTYDEDGLVQYAYISFVDPSCGCFNKNWQSTGRG